MFILLRSVSTANKLLNSSSKVHISCLISKGKDRNLKWNYRKRFPEVVGICRDVFRKSLVKEGVCFVISSASDNLDKLPHFTSPISLGWLSMINTNLPVPNTCISKCMTAPVWKWYLALDEEIRMHLFSCFTAIWFFYRKNTLWAYIIKRYPGKGFRKRCIMVFSLPCAVKELILLPLDKWFL